MSELQLPGAGLPLIERMTAGLLLKSTAWFCSDRSVLKLFRKESTQLSRIFDDDESYDVFQPLLIPRVVGIEDSSRNWSIAMILEHLCLVNSEIIVAIDSLSRGIVPRGEVDVADYKPDPDISVNVLDRFHEINRQYVRAVESCLVSSGNLPHRPAMRHPWFGPLSAHQWHCLAALHQRVHRRQAQKIVAMLGVT